MKNKIKKFFKKTITSGSPHYGHDVLREGVEYHLIGTLKDDGACNSQRLVWVREASRDGDTSLAFLSRDHFPDAFIKVDGKILALKKRGPGKKSTPGEGVQVPKKVLSIHNKGGKNE